MVTSPPAPHSGMQSPLKPRTPRGFTPSSPSRSSSRSAPSPNAPENDVLVPGTLVTPENVHAFANMQILVRTTEAYRRALGAVADPAMNCVGIVVKVKADQVDKHGEGLRVDVLWDNARPLEGYRVGYQRAFDLEAAVPPETGVNPFLASPADSQTLHAQKRSLWSRMKLPFKSPFSSKTQDEVRRVSLTSSSTGSGDDDQLEVAVGYLNAQQSQERARSASMGPQKDTHLWSPVGPVKYAGQEYVQQCGSVSAHHNPSNQTLNIHEHETVQIKISSSAPSAKPDTPSAASDTASATKSAGTLVDTALPPASSHMSSEQDGNAASGASTCEQGPTPNSVMSANPSNVPSTCVSGDTSPGESSPDTSFACPPGLKFSAAAPLAPHTPLETGGSC